MKFEYELPYKININEKNIYILNNFYGQLKSIEIIMHEEMKNKNEIIIFSRLISPFPLKDNGGIIFKSNFKFNKYINEKKFLTNIFKNENNQSKNNNNNNNNNNEINAEICLKIKDINLVKVNYINYKEQNFNVIDYFGGITQFLPFLHIINGLHRNNNIKAINNIEKEEFLIDFAKNILLIIYNHVNISGIKKQENFKKYWIFYLYILNKIEPFSGKNVKIDTNEFKSFNSNEYNNNQGFFVMFKQFLKYINSKNPKELTFLKNLIKNIYLKNENGKNLSLFGKTNKQLYRNKMKQLFIYNRLWSKQYLFFKNVNECYKNNNDNKIKIKYKRINYYTSNFQQPLIYPILEIENYYPSFQKFNKNKLYKNQNDILINYNFSLDNFENNLHEEIVSSYLDNNDVSQPLRCCLIKKMYHVKGIIGTIELSKTDFKIFFYQILKKKKKSAIKTILIKINIILIYVMDLFFLA